MVRFKQLILALGDVAALYGGLFLAVALRNLAWPGETFDSLVRTIWFVFVYALFVLFIIGLYDVGRARNSVEFFQKILVSAGFWMVGSIIIFYIVEPSGITPKTILLLATITGFGIVALWRFIYNKFLSTTIGQTTVALAGNSAAIRELVRIFNAEPARGIKIVGVIGAGNFGSLTELVQSNGGRYPSLVVVDSNSTNSAALLGELYQALAYQVTMVDIADFYERMLGRIPPFTFSETWFITNLKEQQKKIYDRFRILVDYIAAILLGIVFIVTFPLVALGTMLSSRGPIFFSQKRVGRGGIVFTIYKYRTMQALTSSGSAEVSGAVYATKDDPRITGFGKFLRRTRLDELPQVINILRGEMGLIGPRPERPEFVAELTAKMPFYSLRHLVKPGITGWAQLHSGYYGTLEENLLKLEYDLYYIKNRGPLLDLSIGLKTVFVVLKMMGR